MLTSVIEVLTLLFHPAPSLTVLFVYVSSSAPAVADAYALRARNPVFSYELLLMAAMVRLKLHGVQALNPEARKEVMAVRQFEWSRWMWYSHNVGV